MIEPNLPAAISYFEQFPKRWVQGTKACFEPYACIHTVFDRVAEKRFVYPPAQSVAKALGFHDVKDMYAWNDSEGRTVDEVIARLKGAR